MGLNQTAKRTNNKANTAKKLPDKIAKRFKKRREEMEKEDTRWVAATATEVPVEKPTQFSEIQAKRYKQVKRNAANSNRSIVVEARSAELSALISSYAKKPKK